MDASVTSRRSFLKKSLVVASGVAAAGGAKVALSDAAAGARLDADFSTPYQPSLSFSHPSDWYVRTDLLPTVLDPRHVIVSNRNLPQLPTVDGQPNMAEVPADAVLVDIASTPLLADQDTTSAHDLSHGMRWSDFGEGVHDDTPHLRRRFYAWYATAEWSVAVMVFVGSEAAPGWERVAAIINSVRVDG